MVRMGEITKELQSIRANIQLFERADAMKRQLDENMDDLNNRFEKLDSFTDTAEDLQKQYGEIVRMNNDMTRKLEEIEQQKQRVTSLEQKFGQMFALSNTIDERIRTLNTTSDDIGTMEVAVRDFTDKLDLVSQQYESLAKKDEIINRVQKDVDTSFANLKNIEQRIADCERQITSLPNEIKAVQASVDRILANGPKITEAANRVMNLDTVLTETEKRMGEINSTRNGINKTMGDLARVQEEADKKLELVRAVSSEDAKKVKSSNDVLSPKLRDMVRTLKRQGWNNKEIASKLKMSEGEVELILEIPE